MYVYVCIYTYLYTHIHESVGSTYIKYTHIPTSLGLTCTSKLF